MRIMVTGGCGFIGSHIVDYLISLGHSIVVLDNLSSGQNHWRGKNASPELLQIDVLDKNALSKAFAAHKPAVVFHLAAHHYIPFCDNNPAAAYDLNVTGTFNVLNEAHNVDVERIFFASTADVYAPSPRPHMEDAAVGPFTVYGKTKVIGEMICRGTVDWGWHSNLLIGRLFNAVGPRETNPHLVPEVISQIVKGATELRLGNLFPTRDFVDVATEARAIVDATMKIRGIETINIGSGTAIRVGEMIDMILSEAGRNIKVVIDPGKVRAAERLNLCGTTDRLRNLIGYIPNSAGPKAIRAIMEEAEPLAMTMAATVGR